MTATPTTPVTTDRGSRIRPQTLAEYVERALSTHAEHPFLAEIAGGESVTYGEAKVKIAAIRGLLHTLGIRPGDRVALLGANSVNWALSYFALVTSGRIAVPILNEFHPSAIHNILNMAECRVVFVTRALIEKIEGASLPALERVILLEDFQEIEFQRVPELLRQIKEKVETLRQRAEQFLAAHGLPPSPETAPRPDDLAAIVYTSGTTGYSKGVMLTQGNIISDVLAALRYVDLTPADRFLSILPTAHMYECTCVLLASMASGSSVHYLRQKPSPKVLQSAFAEVRPTIVFAVPLIMEKIYRKSVLPRINSRLLLRGMVRVPGLRGVIYRKAVRTLLTTFGGRLRYMGFGGAPLAREVEIFLAAGRFPYFIGYGMTECAPLIAGSRIEDVRTGSCGTAVEGLDLRISEPRPTTGIGEVQVRGPMVTTGYYRNPEATALTFTADGWLRTGDLGFLDADGHLFLKGRSKNVILGPSGENIYPEEIEHLLLQSRHVVECLVTRTEGVLTARIFPDLDLLSQELHLVGLSDRQVATRLDEVFRALLVEVNSQLGEYSRLSGYTLVDREFEKTPTEKIKRHLYS